MENLKNRSEILFLYDVRDANPNGDPVDENKPRIDEETGINLVTDVRLKRTIRDYLHEIKNKEIFIVEERDEKGNLKTKEDRLTKFKNEPSEVIAQCMDMRLFGATTAVKDKSIAITGPVQFKYGKSLHRVSLKYIKGTTVMPSKADSKQGTFTERYILPYSLLAFYGMVNEKAAELQKLNLSENDVKDMLDAIWNGTKNLSSCSKFGQMPRLLLQVVYNENQEFFLGELDKRIKLVTEKLDEEIRDVSEIKLDVTELSKALAAHKDTIKEIRFKADERLTLIGKDFNGLTVKEFNF